MKIIFWQNDTTHNILLNIKCTRCNFDARRQLCKACKSWRMHYLAILCNVSLRFLPYVFRFSKKNNSHYNNNNNNNTNNMTDKQTTNDGPNRIWTHTNKTCAFCIHLCIISSDPSPTFEGPAPSCRKSNYKSNLIKLP